ncbi:MAG: carboxymuconolactone decarboxylase family protein [Anaerolineae bacterium]
MADYETSEHFDAAERAAIAYADRMTDIPVNVSDDLFDELKSHFNDKQIVELTAIVARENYRARFNHALGIGSDGFSSEGAFCPVPVRA